MIAFRWPARLPPSACAPRWPFTVAARATLVLVAAAVSAVTTLAHADDDLPGRVGRIADFGGAVSIAPGDRPDQWEPAEPNRTVIGGDNLWVEKDGRAEIDYGGGQVRLAGETSALVTRLDDRVVALYLAQGAAILRVRVLDPGDGAQVDTPNAQVQIVRPGTYRVDVAAEGSRTMVTVREGEAGVAIPAGNRGVLAGQSVEVVGAAGDARAEYRVALGFDGFDGWSASRDARYERSRTATYVSRQMVGYADLDEYGTWEQSAEYGSVWYPTAVAGDWAPYRFGRWTWLPGFGWTWVDDAPWGYAPFHYGRWAYVGGRWGWCPGAFVARPAWAPAMVAWYGGPSWSFSVSAGGPVYGWVPLGWGEPYIPAWRNCSHHCWTFYNRPYAVRYAERPATPPSRYVNQAAPGGFTVVNRETVATGRRVGGALVPVPLSASANAPVLAAAPIEVRPAPSRIPGAPRATASGNLPPATTMYPAERRARPALGGAAGPSTPVMRTSPPVNPGAAIVVSPDTPRARATRPIEATTTAPRTSRGATGSSPPLSTAPTHPQARGAVPAADSAVTPGRPPRTLAPASAPPATVMPQHAAPNAQAAHRPPPAAKPPARQAPAGPETPPAAR